MDGAGARPNSIKINVLVFFLFFSVSLALRFHTFALSVVDWDETLHLMIAMALRDGHPPYITMWDHKPPGLHIIFALGLMIFRDPIFTIRILTCLAVSVTGLGLFGILRRLEWVPRSGAVLAGLLYAVFSINNGGLAANAELFFAPFVVFSFYLLFGMQEFPTGPKEKGGASFLAIGLLLGIAMQIKFLVFFDILGVVACLFLLLKGNGETRVIRKWVVGTGMMAVFPTLILIGIGAYYFLIGHFDEFYFANFTSNRIYGELYSFDFKGMVFAFVEQIGGHYFIWLGALSSIILLASAGDPSRIREKKWIGMMAVWSLAILPGICLTKQYWPHYFLQLYPAFCLMTAVVISVLLKPVFSSSRPGGIILVILLLVGPVHHEASGHLKSSVLTLRDFVKTGERFPGDVPAAIAAYVDERTSPDDFIFMIDVLPVVYVLADVRIPTRFAYPPFLIGKESSVIAGIDPLVELQAIMAKKPAFLVRKRSRPDPAGTVDAVYEQVGQHIDSDYILVRTFSGIDVYQRKSQ